jgi:hypothetical protein
MIEDICWANRTVIISGYGLQADTVRRDLVLMVKSDGVWSEAPKIPATVDELLSQEDN